jgi:uncharacterized membrane protein YvlD (DUF360 family)
MRKVGRIIAIICFVIASLLGLLTLITWEPGGLFFALPFIFLWPGLFFLLIGIILYLITRESATDKNSIEENNTAT